MSDASPPSDGRLRVVVVDADDRVRESLAGILVIGDRIEVVGSAGGADPALEIVAAVSPDIVVVDPRLPELDSGLGFITRLRRIVPGIRILAMGWSGGPEDGAVAAATDGFIRKTYRPRELVAAVIEAAGAVADDGASAPRAPGA
jgi:DNA-binding NarL/FixJ family response regulator